MFGGVYYDLVIYTCYLAMSIPVWVFLMIGFQIYYNRGIVLKAVSENFWAEFCWTFVPYLLVFFLCFLNVQFIGANESLYSVFSNCGVVKIIGRQWYWSYDDYMCGGGLYDSFITDFVGVVDKPLRLEYGVPYNLLVTSADVIHSFALPDFAVKLDAIPGRIASCIFLPERCGVFVGYCSELCGAGHAYMPIVVEVLVLGKK